MPVWASLDPCQDQQQQQQKALVRATLWAIAAAALSVTCLVYEECQVCLSD